MERKTDLTINTDIFFKDFISGVNSITYTDSGEPLSLELQQSIVVLLFEFARCDLKFGSRELEELLRCSEKMLGCSRVQTAKMIEVGELLGDNQTRVQACCELIVENLSPSQRQVILKTLWKIAAADHVVEKAESAFISSLRLMLKLSLEQGTACCILAEKELEAEKKAKEHSVKQVSATANEED